MSLVGITPRQSMIQLVDMAESRIDSNSDTRRDDLLVVSSMNTSRTMTTSRQPSDDQSGEYIYFLYLNLSFHQ